MARGAVYYHPQFKIHDNETGVKRFVILNEPHGDEPFLVAKTTTNLRDKQHAIGCNAALKVFYVPKGNEIPFPLDTLVQLDELYEFSSAELMKSSLQDKILEHKGELSALTMSQLVNCLKKLKNDIPEAYFEMINRR